MTKIVQIAIPTTVGAKDPKPVLEKLAETVNMLQGATDQDQRAVRVFEFDLRLSELETRLKKAGF